MSRESTTIMIFQSCLTDKPLFTCVDIRLFILCHVLCLLNSCRLSHTFSYIPVVGLPYQNCANTTNKQKVILQDMFIITIQDLKNPAYGRQSISRPMRIVAPIPQQGGPRIAKNPNFLKNGKNHPKRKNSKRPRDMPILAIYPSTRGL